MTVVATAGHVDHGKSTLVRALTGTDPDRLAEERARGLTIDLGFAVCELPSGRSVGFVDVPGHERFVKNMLAGVGAVDVALLCVAADEGWKPQTEEHAQILDLLDVRHGLVALTKCARVDPGTIARLGDELRARTGWPVVAVDAPAGHGLGTLRAALDRVLDHAPPPRDVARPRLWIDRVFVAKGAGTVVTGTLTGGALARGEQVVVEPGGRAARIRRIESHHRECDRVTPGTRVALNLAGVDHTDLHRGLAVVVPGQWTVTDTFDVALRALPGRAFRGTTAVDVHAGAGEQLARLRVLDDDATFGRLRLPAPLPLAPGDRVVLRSSATRATIGGGEVLDVSPTPRPADAPARLRRPLAARVLDARPWCTRAEMDRLAGDDRAADGYATVVGEWIVAPDTVAAVRARAAELVRGGPRDVSAVAGECGIDTERLRGCLAGDPVVTIDGDSVRDRGQPALADAPASRAYVDALLASPLAPPAPADRGVSGPALRALVRAGAVVELDGIVFATAAVDEARTRVARLVLEHDSVTIADVRRALGTTRRHAVAIVNRMDAEGVTRRRGDVRVAGPRAGAT